MKELFNQLIAIYGENNILAIVDNYIIHIQSIDDYILNHARMNNDYEINGKQYVLIDIVYFVNLIMNGNLDVLMQLISCDDNVYLNPNFETLVRKLVALCAESIHHNFKVIGGELRKRIANEKKLIFSKAPYDKEALLNFIKYSSYYSNEAIQLTAAQLTILNTIKMQPLDVNFVKNIVHDYSHKVNAKTVELNAIVESMDSLLELRKQLDLLIIEIIKLAYDMNTIVALI